MENVLSIIFTTLCFACSVSYVTGEDDKRVLPLETKGQKIISFFVGVILIGSLMVALDTGGEFIALLVGVIGLPLSVLPQYFFKTKTQYVTLGGTIVFTVLMIYTQYFTS